MSEATLRIVIADEQDLLRTGLAIFIESHKGMVLVGEASDGETAVQVVPQVKPDIVVMDVNLPRLDGVEVIRQIKQLAPQTRILVFTLEHEQERLQAASAAGADAYLPKAVSPDTLVETIRT